MAGSTPNSSNSYAIVHCGPKDVVVLQKLYYLAGLGPAGCYAHIRPGRGRVLAHLAVAFTFMRAGSGCSVSAPLRLSTTTINGCWRAICPRPGPGPAGGPASTTAPADTIAASWDVAG